MIYKKKPNQPSSRPCDYPDCPECGQFRAPKDRSLREYYWFCLKHVTQYNKNWNFFQGLSSDEIEEHIQNDTTWQRPTWKLGQKQVFQGTTDKIGDSFGLFNEAELGMSGKYNPPQKPVQKHEKKLLAAAHFLEVDFPLKLSEIKSQFKKLAKKYHPDANQGDKQAEQKFKELLDHYRYLLKHFGEIK